MIKRNLTGCGITIEKGFQTRSRIEDCCDIGAMAFQSRFRETERHAFGSNSAHGGDASAGEPSEVRT